MNELTIGAFGVSAVLSVILRMVYSVVNVPNRWKPILSILIGAALGVVALYYSGGAIGFRAIVDSVIAGIMVGSTAVGMYETTKRRGG